MKGVGERQSYANKVSYNEGLKNWKRERETRWETRQKPHAFSDFNTAHNITSTTLFLLGSLSLGIQIENSLDILKGVLLTAVFKSVTSFTFRQVLVKIPESLFSFITMLWWLYYKMAKQQGWVRQGTCFGTQTYYMWKSWSQTPPLFLLVLIKDLNSHIWSKPWRNQGAYKSLSLRAFDSSFRVLSIDQPTHEFLYRYTSKTKLPKRDKG